MLDEQQDRDTGTADQATAGAASDAAPNEGAEEKPAEAAAAPPPKRKKERLSARLRTYARKELARIDTWKMILAEEGKPLYAGMADDDELLTDLLRWLDQQEANEKTPRR